MTFNRYQKSKTIFKYLYKLIAILILLSIFIVKKRSCNYTLNRRLKNSFYLNSITPDNHNVCPLCGIDSTNKKNEKPLHKIVECVQLNETSTPHQTSHSNVKIYLPSYKCKCKYMKLNENRCNWFSKSANEKFTPLSTSNESDQDEGQLSPINECLVVHVGMAIKGFNLIYRQWINKENCFNLCINTTIKNGFNFDCKSFEHWHADCANQPNDLFTKATDSTENSTIIPNICASFSNDHGYSARRTHRHHNYLPNSLNKINYRQNRAAAAKIDYCVLSNQTIRTSGKNFALNNAVTYYELLCRRPAHDTKKSVSSQKSTTKSKEESSEINNFTSVKPSFITPTISVSKSSTKKYKTNKTTNNDRTTTKTNEPISMPKTVDKKKNRFLNTTITTTTDSTHLEDFIPPSKKCKFNPCQNDGVCLLIESQRFTCSCKEFYYGVYCENNAIQKTCHKKHMEILVYQDLADQFQIKINDLFINEIKTQTYCKLKPLNESHAVFHIPYEKCGTKVLNNKLEKVYTSRLYSLLPITMIYNTVHVEKEDENKYYLASFECRFDKQVKTTTQSNQIIKEDDDENDVSNNNNNFIITNNNNNDLDDKSIDKLTTKSTIPCIIDMLNLKVKLYSDENFRRELLTDSDNYVSKKLYINYDQQIFVQFSVDYSEKLDELYQLQDRLQYFHLTIEKCWLTRTQNENTNIFQILIENGCPKETVKFYDATLTKNSIRFSFYYSNFIKKMGISQSYLHCFPEVCTDAPKDSKDYSFYSQFKSCYNISTGCEMAYHQNNKLNSNEYIELESLEEQNLYSIKTNTRFLQNQCNNKFSKGPIYLTNDTSKFKTEKVNNDDSKTSINITSSSSSMYLFSWPLNHFWFYLFLCYFKII